MTRRRPRLSRTVPGSSGLSSASPPSEFLSGLPQGFSLKDHAHEKTYEGMQEGVNDFKLPGYRGPSPPAGDHRYEIWLFALDSRVDAGHKVR